MDDLHAAYLDLLDELSADLEKLAALAQEQTNAVRRDDLNALNDVMKREQAVGLSLRGREQHRLKLAAQLGLSDVRLTELAAHVPNPLAARARQCAERAHNSYTFYHEAAGVARSTLEINLHEIDKILAAQGIDPAQSTQYMEPHTAQPPSNMKTDFRA